MRHRYSADEVLQWVEWERLSRTCVFTIGWGYEISPPFIIIVPGLTVEFINSQFHRTSPFDAILAGAEDVLGDLGVRQAIRKIPKDARL